MYLLTILLRLSLTIITAILIQDHDKEKIIFASSDNQKFIKKIHKLKWNVYEELEVSNTLKKKIV